MVPHERDEPDSDMAERLAAYEERGGRPAAGETLPTLDAGEEQRLQDDKGFLDFLTQTWPTPENAATPAALGSFGRFQVLRELGRGGFGMVFLAWDPTHQRQVALKVPRLEALVTPGVRRLFLREAQIAAELDHPHLTRVYEVGEVGPICFLASAYSPGVNLSEWLLRRMQPVSPRQAAELVAILAKPVAFLHTRGIVHRDLKPTNVLLELREGEDVSSFGIPRIADFGLARLMEHSSGAETTTGVLLGSPCYMAPEQALDRRDQVGSATDVYALGVLLYEVLTGRTPFQGRTPLEVFRHMLGDEPPRLRSLRPDVPRTLEAVCERCLQQNPRHRYARAADLAADLTCFARGEPVSVRPAGTLRRSLRWVRRHWAKTALFAALVFIVLALPLGLFLHGVRLQGALDEAERQRTKATRNEAVAQSLQYASDMALADKMLREGEVFRLPGLLDRHVPDPNGADDRRGFEWWYLNRYRHAPPTARKAHSGSIVFVAYGADGQSLLSAGGKPDNSPHTLKVWGHSSTSPLLSIPAGAGPYGNAIAFAPRERLLATLAGDGHTVIVRDALTGRTRGRLSSPSGVWAVALSPDGRLLATGGEGPITLWDWSKRKRLRGFSDDSRQAIQLAFSPDGRSLASRRAGKTDILEWEVAIGRPRRKLDQPKDLRGILYSPRGAFLVAACDPPALWGRDGTLGRTWLPALTTDVSAVAISTDERQLAIGTAAGDVHLWDLSSRRRLASFLWQANRITRLAFSPDGRFLAGGTTDGMVYQLNTAVAGGPDTLRPSLIAGGGVVLSPDGNTLAVVDADRGVRLLDTRTRRVRLVLPSQLNAVARVAFAPDGRTLATTSIDASTLRLWDTTTGREKLTLFLRHGARAGCIAFAPTGSRLVIGQMDGQILFGDPTTGATTVAPTRHAGEVWAAAFAAKGRILATGGTEGTVLVWDIGGTEPLKARPGLKLSKRVTSLAFSPDGRTLVTGEDDGRIRLWRVGPKGPPVTWTTLVEGNRPQVLELSFSSDGRTLLSADRPGNVRLWDFTTRRLRRQINLERGLDQNRPPAALSPDGRTLFTVRGDGTLESWDLHDQTIRAVLEQGLGGVRSLAFTPDGGTLIVGSPPADEVVTRIQSVELGSLLRKQVRMETVPLREPGSTVRLWNLASGTERQRLPGASVMQPPVLVAVAPAGPMLAAGGDDGSVWVWDHIAGRFLARRFISREAEDYYWKTALGHSLLAARPKYPESVCSVALSPDGRLLAAASNRGTVTLWDADGWRRRHSWRGADSPWVGFAPDGKTLAIARGGQVLFRDVGTGALRRTLGERNDPAVHCGAFDPGGSFLAVGYFSRAIRLWDLKTGRPSATLIGHRDRISSLTFSPDGNTLASSSWDRTARLWNVAARQEVLTLEAHQGRVHSVAFSPDGKILATGGESESGMGEVYLWRSGRP